MRPERLTFVVTAATRGFPRDLPVQLLEAGHRVFLVDNSQEAIDHIRPLLEKTYKHERDFLLGYIDTTNPESVRQAASRAAEAFNGKLDCLVINAAYDEGESYRGRLDRLSPEAWTRVQTRSMVSRQLVIQEFLGLLSVARGCIANVSATRTFTDDPHNEPMGMARGMVSMWTQMLLELTSPQNVRVNAVLPGWIDGYHKYLRRDESDADLLLSMEALSAEERNKVEGVRKAVMYLVENKDVTGAELAVGVDGAYTQKAAGN